MAIITLRDPYESVRGKVNGELYGGVLFPKEGRMFRRNWVLPSNPQSDMQDILRSYFAAASAAYSLLTVAQKTLWDEAALLEQNKVTDKNGNLYSRTGKGLYVSVNVNRLIDGQVQTSTAPSAAKAIPITSVTGITYSPPNFQIVVTYPAALSSGKFLIMLSRELAGSSRVARETDCNIPTTSPANAVFAVTGSSPQTINLVIANCRTPWSGYDDTNRLGLLIHTMNSDYVLNQAFLEPSIELL